MFLSLSLSLSLCLPVYVLCIHIHNKKIQKYIFYNKGYLSYLHSEPKGTRTLRKGGLKNIKKLFSQEGEREEVIEKRDLWFGAIQRVQQRATCQFVRDNINNIIFLLLIVKDREGSKLQQERVLYYDKISTHTQKQAVQKTKTKELSLDYYKKLYFVAINVFQCFFYKQKSCIITVRVIIFMSSVSIFVRVCLCI